MKKPTLLSHSAALRLVLKYVPPVNATRGEWLNLTGRALREPIKADRPYPPFNRSAMDGYAVRFGDFKNGRALLRCVGTLEAGSAWKGKLKKGEALKIMTGAPVPDGGDMVVMVERSRTTDAAVELYEPGAERWLNVHRMGADAEKGEILVPQGELLGPFRISVAASAGAANPLVSRRIRTCVISTGNEVIDVYGKPEFFRIRDANSSHLLARLSRIELTEASFGGLIPDDRAIFRKTIQEAIRKNDMVIISGGVSMGDSDYTCKTLEELGVRRIFHKCAIRPGKPVWFGRKGKTVVFGLPGNPVSVAATFHEFVYPAIRKMAGLKNPGPRAVLLPLAAAISKKHPYREFRVANISPNGKAVGAVKGYKGSGDFISASKSDGVIVIPEGTRTLPAGRLVEFHPWNL